MITLLQYYLYPCVSQYLHSINAIYTTDFLNSYSKSILFLLLTVLIITLESFLLIHLFLSTITLSQMSKTSKLLKNERLINKILHSKSKLSDYVQLICSSLTLIWVKMCLNKWFATNTQSSLKYSNIFIGISLLFIKIYIRNQRPFSG